MPSPKTRRRTRGSAIRRPIMVLLDLLGRRMALRILWELRDERRLTFRALQEAAATNPGVLNARLRELREAHLVAHEDEGYGLTRQGKELLATFLPLHTWAEKWAAGVQSGRR
jgi:DNA-binding HxlR family transcriptional regulator